MVPGSLVLAKFVQQIELGKVNDMPSYLGVGMSIIWGVPIGVFLENGATFFSGKNLAKFGFFRLSMKTQFLTSFVCHLCMDSSQNNMFRPQIDLAMFGGLRLHEIRTTQLRGCDFDFSKNRFFTWYQWKPIFWQVLSATSAWIQVKTTCFVHKET